MTTSAASEPVLLTAEQASYLATLVGGDERRALEAIASGAVVCVPAGREAEPSKDQIVAAVAALHADQIFDLSTGVVRRMLRSALNASPTPPPSAEPTWNVRIECQSCGARIITAAPSAER